MSQRSRTVPQRRFNPRAAIQLALVLVAMGACATLYKAFRNTDQATSFLAEAKKRLESDRPDLALQYLDQYLAAKGGDVDALELKAKILAESAHTVEQAAEAMPIHNQILGLEPDNPKRQETRRRLVKLNLQVPGRGQAAESLARDLIRRGANDAEAHRLLAETLERAEGKDNAKALEEATREYLTAEQIEPGDIGGAERLAALYRDKLGEPQKAREVMDKVLELSKHDSARLAQAHLARARFFSGTSESASADTEVAEALKNDPKNLDVLLAAADVANRQGDAKAARGMLNQIPKDQRNDLRFKLLEGLIEVTEQRPDEAVRSWREGLLQTGGNSPELTWRLAQVLIDTGRVNEAEPLMDQYRRLIGGDNPPPAHDYLNGFALLRKGRPAEAIKVLEALRYKAPKSIEGHMNYLLGQCYEQVSDPLKASDAYRQATKANPEWSAPWIALANLEAAEGGGESAFRVLGQGLAIAPNDARLLVNSALILWRQQVALPTAQRSWKEFEQLLERAEKADPHSSEAALIRADYLSTLGKNDEALAHLASAVARTPKALPLQLAQANLLNRLGRTQEAIAKLDQAIAADPQANYFVLQASYQLALGHVKPARALLFDGLNRVPENQRPQIWRSLGELAVTQSDLVSARDAFSKWAQLVPNQPEPRAALLELAMKSDDAKAIRAEVEALKNVGGPDAPYWKLARAEELLRVPSAGSTESTNRTAQFKEAAALIRAIQSSLPQSSAGFVLEGRLREQQGKIDEALAAYEKALKLKGGQTALTPLMTLLAREKRDADLERIRKTHVNLPPELDRLAMVQALKAGDHNRAEQLAARMVEGDPQGFDARIWQAQVLNELGKTKEAEAALRALTDAHPNDATPWLQLLMLQVSQKRFKDAESTVEKIKTHVKVPQPEILWAQCYRVVGKLEQAEASYQAALQRYPDQINVRSAAVAYFEETGRSAEAEASLRHVLKLDPAQGWASRKLALLLANRQGDISAWNEALNLVGTATRADDTPEDRLTRARVLARGSTLHFRNQAIEILEKLTTELPNITEAHELLARLYLGSGQGEKALAHAQKGAADGSSPNAILLYANLLLNAKAFDEAGRQLDRVAGLNTNGLAVAELKARIQVARGDQNAAAKTLETAFQDQADAPGAFEAGEKMVGLLLQLGLPETAERIARRLPQYGVRGICAEGLFLAGQGRFDEAASRFELAAQQGGLDHAGTAALILASRPNPDARWIELAGRYFDQALTKNPESIDLLQKVARVRYLQGQFTEQVALYEKILELEPKDFTFLNDMAWTLSEDLKQPAEALKRVDELISRGGVQANVLDTRGVILTRLDRLDDAIKDLEAAAAAQPSGPIAFHLARAYQKQGRVEEFKKARDDARTAKLQPNQLQPSELPEWQEVMEN